MGLPVGFITRELWEIVVRGLWRRGISLYGSSVGEPGEEAPLLESLKVVREGSGDGYPALWGLSWATWSGLIGRGPWFMVERGSGGVASLSVGALWREPGGRASLLGTLKVRRAQGMDLPVGFITRELWGIVVRGLWRRGISVYGSSVGEPGEGAPLLGSLKVVREGSGDGFSASWGLSWATWSVLIDRGLRFMVEGGSGGVASLSVGALWREPGGRASLLGTLKGMYKRPGDRHFFP